MEHNNAGVRKKKRNHLLKMVIIAVISVFFTFNYIKEKENVGGINNLPVFMSYILFFLLCYSMLTYFIWMLKKLKIVKGSICYMILASGILFVINELDNGNIAFENPLIKKYIEYTFGIVFMVGFFIDLLVLLSISKKTKAVDAIGAGSDNETIMFNDEQEIHNAMGKQIEQFLAQCQETLSILEELTETEFEDINHEAFVIKNIVISFVEKYSEIINWGKMVEVSLDNWSTLRNINSQMVTCLENARDLKRKYYRMIKSYTGDKKNTSQMNLFANCKDKEEAAALYKSLIKAFHPDNKGGNNEMFVKLQQEYQELCNKNQW